MSTPVADPPLHIDTRPESVVNPPTVLSGPEGHPFHPIAVTLPIGAWVSSLIFDVASRVSDDPQVFGRGAIWLLLIGAVGAVPAAVLGALDLRAVPAGTPARRVGVVHAALNSIVLVTLTVSALVRLDRWGQPFETAWWAIVVSAAAVVLLGISGSLGGRLAYHYGIRVASTEMQAEGFDGAGAGADRNGDGLSRR